MLQIRGWRLGQGIARVTCGWRKALGNQLRRLRLVPVDEALQQGDGEAIARPPGSSSLGRAHHRSQLPAWQSLAIIHPIILMLDGRLLHTLAVGL